MNDCCEKPDDAVRNYWIVGAMWNGNKNDDALPMFFRRGYWCCWDPKEDDPNNPPQDKGPDSIPKQRGRMRQIKIGDRIAVKKKFVEAQELEVRALGIVKDVDFNEWRVYVEWLHPAPQEMCRRVVPLRGMTAAIHGPFKRKGNLDPTVDPWIQEIFCI
jgi:hypothetical protein